MKCENCGKNEVTFYYQSNVNGKVEEKHLCSECAEKLGYTQKIHSRGQSLMNSMFGGSLFDDFFSPMPHLLGGMDRFFGEDLFDDFFRDMPALTAAPVQQQEAPAEEKKDDLVGKEEQSRFARMRQLNALRMEMKKAVHEENFERAAELRDQIHQLEKDGKEDK
jgi:protein arginine kinase activator